MWHERAEYGHFFYRIPNGESAADAYDRISGFNESLWRSFKEDNFASVCVLVTHGLMTRVFLMKWYHWSVEYFEDLRNVNHCEFIVMAQNESNGKYILKNQLRTWTQWRKEQAEMQAEKRRTSQAESPVPMRKRWGTAHDHVAHLDFRIPRRQNTAELFKDDMHIHDHESSRPASALPKTPASSRLPHELDIAELDEPDTPTQDSATAEADSDADASNVTRLAILKSGRDGGGTLSGRVSPASGSESDPTSPAIKLEHLTEAERRKQFRPPHSMALALSGAFDSEEDGRRGVAMADALGDQSDMDEDEELSEEAKAEREEERGFGGSVR